MSIALAMQTGILSGGSIDLFPLGRSHTWDARLGYSIGVGVNAWNDQVAAVNHQQLNTLFQPPYTVINPALNGEPTISPDGINDYMDAPGSLGISTIKQLHDGTGVTVYVGANIINPAPSVSYECILCTSQAVGGGLGLWLGMYQTNRFGLVIMNGAGFTVFSIPVYNAGPCSIVLQHGILRSPQWQLYRNNVSIASGAYSGANPPSSLSSVADLTFFASPLGTNRWSSTQVGLIHFWPSATISVPQIQIGHDARFTP